MDKFTRQYFETALWSSTDNSDDQGGEPLDKNYSVSDIADETRDKMIADCADFQERFGELYSDSEQAGHDFWLSRNGHGAGFFDGDEERRDELQAAAKSYGEFDLYIGDDGEIHGTPLDIHRMGEARGHRVAARHEPVEDPFYIVQPLWIDGTIVGGLGGGGGESFGYDDEGVAVQEAEKLLRDPTFEGDYVQVITRDGELVWSSRDEDEMSETSNTSDLQRTADALHGTHWFKRTARGPDPFHREAPDWVRSGKALCGAEIRNPALTVDSPMPMQQKLCAKCVRLSMRGDGRTREAREASPVVHDYIAVDRNDRVIAGPFKSRDEADRHVPPGGYVKFATAHRRGPPGPAPSSYPMFREGSSKIHFQSGDRVRIRVIGPQGQLADPPFWHTIDYPIDLEELALQFSQNIQPGMFVSISDGKNSWTFKKETTGGQNTVRRTSKLPTARYRENKEAGGRARRPKARAKRR